MKETEVDIENGCNYCGTPFKRFKVDGKTISGPWAWMCLSCFELKGNGLGVGRGQLYQYDYREKVWKKIVG